MCHGCECETVSIEFTFNRSPIEEFTFNRSPIFSDWMKSLSIEVILKFPGRFSHKFRMKSDMQHASWLPWHCRILKSSIH